MSIKFLCTNTVSYVRINGPCLSWFNVGADAHQGDPLLPTLFSLFINEIILEIKQTGSGASVENKKISLLIYADGIILLFDIEEDLQKSINTVTECIISGKYN